MNVQCAICQDLLGSTTDVFSTPCGHVFHFLCLTKWLDNSPTCPQCRQKCDRKKTTRLYFTASNSESVTEDSYSLQSKVDNLSFQIKLREQELIKAKEEKAKVVKQNIGLKDHINRVERDLNNNKLIIDTLKEQIQHFKEKAEKVDIAQAKVDKLKETIQNYHNVQTLLAQSDEDVEDMLDTVHDQAALKTYINVMKKEFTVSTNKRKELRDNVRKLQKDFHDEKLKHQKVIESLRSRIEDLETKYVSCVSENEQLKKKFSNKDGVEACTDKELEDKTSRKRDSDSNMSEMFDSEISPRKKSKSIDNLEIINLSDYEIKSTMQKTKSNLENVENSPNYLQTKSKSLLGAKQRPTQRGAFVMGKKSVATAKKPDKGIPAPRDADSFVSYNGFGGHSTPDIFPESSGLKIKRSVTESSKNKKQKIEHKRMDDFVINLT